MSYGRTKYSAMTEAFEHKSIRVDEIHFHLGDVLPPGSNYRDEDNVTLKLVLHYSDPYGRDKTKTITLPSTTIL